ncbi:MAG: response regulator, partial [Anaerolineales bacterium]
MSEVKILLCDDDADLLGLLIRRLKKMGIEPDTASDGREAKSLVDANNYDVIVTDIYMPEATGLEVMQHAKQKDADTQVVIITSSATLDNAIDALNHGAFGYLTKPFDHLIVFDNMVSRALEYRQLVVADKRKAEAQRRRGDMLEDEVAQRVQQLQKTQKGLLDLLGSLPDGILVVEEGGKVVLSSPVGERWLSLDQKSDDQPIHAFVGQVHAETPDPFADVTVDGTDLHLMTANFPAEGEAKRKAVIIREMEDIAGAGSMVTETVMGIKKGLATLYEQGMGTEVVLNVASQFAVLEQLQGWSTGTGELEPSKVEAEAPAPSTPAEAPAPPALTEAPETPTPAETPATPAPGEAPATPAPAQTPPAPPVPAAAPSQEQSPAPENPAQAPTDPEGMTTVPPFTLPRERTPTGELEGPRLNTSELQDALRATAPPEAQQAAAEPSIESPVPPESTAEPQAPIADPMAETLVSSAQELSQGSAIAAAPEETSIIEHTGAQIPAETPLEESGSKEAEGVAPAADVVAPFDPDAQPMGAVDPTVMDEAPAPPGEDSETSDDTEPNSFPRAVAGSADVPSWIDGIEGITDPDLLQD